MVDHVYVKFGDPSGVLLSAHAHIQGVDISFTVCLLGFFCNFARLRISPARIKLAASNFARWFIGVQGRETPILGNFAPPEAENRINRRAASGRRIGMCG